MAQMRKCDCQVQVKSSADNFFDAFKNKAHLMPKMSGQVISDIKLVEGDWSTVGSVRLWYVVVGDKRETNKEVFEDVDDDTRTIVYKLTGDILKDFKSWKATLSITPMGKGSLVKWTFEYEKRNDDVPEPVKYCDFCLTWSKNVDTHLLNA